MCSPFPSPRSCLNREVRSELREGLRPSTLETGDSPSSRIVPFRGHDPLPTSHSHSLHVPFFKLTSNMNKSKVHVQYGEVIYALQQFTRSSRRDLALDELDHVQREGADRHDDGNLPSKTHRYDERKIFRRVYVNERPSLSGWDNAPKYSGKKTILTAYSSSVTISAMTI